jgi:hypothetical protein
MKDIIITQKRIKKEITTFLVCLLVGILANVGAIICYKTSFSELFTSLHYIVAFSVALYLLWSFIRIVAVLVSSFLKKQNTCKTQRREDTNNN